MFDGPFQVIQYLLGTWVLVRLLRPREIAESVLLAAVFQSDIGIRQCPDPADARRLVIGGTRVRIDLAREQMRYRKSPHR